MDLGEKESSRRPLMTYFSIFAQSSTALRGHAQALATIATNVVNSTTPDYKQSDTRFASELSAHSDAIYPGFGGITPKTQNFIDKQGAVLATTRDLNIAIAVRGFFVVNSQFDKSGEILLPRQGRCKNLPLIITVQTRHISQTQTETSCLAGQPMVPVGSQLALE
jgi:flagellar basal body rod protein FlgG